MYRRVGAMQIEWFGYVRRDAGRLAWRSYGQFVGFTMRDPLPDLQRRTRRSSPIFFFSPPSVDASSFQNRPRSNSRARGVYRYETTTYFLRVARTPDTACKCITITISKNTVFDCYIAQFLIAVTNLFSFLLFFFFYTFFFSFFFFHP